MSPQEYRQHRIAIGFTQAGLATVLGIARESVVRRESGKQRISKEAQIAIEALPAVVGRSVAIQPTATVDLDFTE